MTDAAKLPLMLTELRLPTIERLWQELGAAADKEGWGAARFLAILCEHELAERATRRIARHMAESGLPAGKTLETFDFAAAPSIRKAHITALATNSTSDTAAARLNRRHPHDHLIAQPTQLDSVARPPLRPLARQVVHLPFLPARGRCSE